MTFYYREVDPKEAIHHVFMEADFLNAAVYVHSESRRACISTAPVENFDCVFDSRPEESCIN